MDALAHTVFDYNGSILEHLRDGARDRNLALTTLCELVLERGGSRLVYALAQIIRQAPFILKEAPILELTDRAT